MKRLIAVALLVALVGCADDKSDLTDDVTDCVAEVAYERSTGSTLPESRC